MNRREKNCYAGYSSVQNDVMTSSSGGIFWIIVKNFLSKYKSNGYVAGAVWRNDYKEVIHICTNSISEIEKMKGAKYIQSNKGKVFKEIKEKLESNKFVLFSGTPCEVAGLKRFLGSNYETLFTLDFICMGPTSQNILENYISLKEERYSADVCDLQLRYKWKRMDNWIPQYINIKFKNGKHYFNEFYNTMLGQSFRLFPRLSCSDCKFRWDNSVSDITLADFHGVNRSMSYFNSKGTSAIMVHSAKGELCIHELIEMGAVLEAVDYEQIYANNLKDRHEVLDTRENFAVIACKDGYNEAVSKNISFNLRIKMKLPWYITRTFYRTKTTIKEKLSGK